LPAADLLLGEDHLDGAFTLEPPKGRVERAVGNHPEAPQRVGQVLLELVAVHRALLQEPQDGQFEHGVRSFPRVVVVSASADMASRYISSIYRDDISRGTERQPAAPSCRLPRGYGSPAGPSAEGTASGGGSKD